MKSLKFAPNLVPLVLSGEKNSTWRLFDDKGLEKGDRIDLVNKSTGESFAHAVIVSVREKKLGDLVEVDFDGHEKFESKEKMYEAYRKYYGNSVSPDTEVKIVRFSLVG